MTEAYARKLKRWNLIALTGTLLFLVLLTAGAFWLWCRVFGPPEALRENNPLLTPQAAAEQLDLGATALWDTASYTITEDSGLDTLLHTDQWTATSPFQDDEADLVLRFGELYQLSLWSDGRADFYFGYSGRTMKSHAYYAIPNDVVGELTSSLSSSSV